MATRIFVLINIGLATISLSTGFWLHREWGGSGLVLALGTLWLAGSSRRRAWLHHTLFSAFVALAAYGAWAGATTGWLLSTVIAALVAWEAMRFERCLAQAPALPGESAHRRRHRQRLLSLAGGSLLLGTLALILPFPLNLTGAVCLGLVIVVGLGRVVSIMRRSEEKRDRPPTIPSR